MPTGSADSAGCARPIPFAAIKITPNWTLVRWQQMRAPLPPILSPSLPLTLPGLALCHLMGANNWHPTDRCQCQLVPETDILPQQTWKTADRSEPKNRTELARLRERREIGKGCTRPKVLCRSLVSSLLPKIASKVRTRLAMPR